MKFISTLTIFLNIFNYGNSTFLRGHLTVPSVIRQAKPTDMYKDNPPVIRNVKPTDMYKDTISVVRQAKPTDMYKDTQPLKRLSLRNLKETDFYKDYNIGKFSNFYEDY